MPNININVDTRSIDNIDSILLKLEKYCSQIINNQIYNDIIKYLYGASSSIGKLNIQSNNPKYLEDVKLEAKLFTDRFKSVSPLSSYVKPEVTLTSKKIIIQFDSENLYSELELISAEITQRTGGNSAYNNFPDLYLQYFTKAGRKSSPKRYSFIPVNGRNAIYSQYGLGYMSEIKDGSDRPISKASIESINLLEAALNYNFNNSKFLNKIYSILKKEIILNKVTKNTINYLVKNIKGKNK